VEAPNFERQGDVKKSCLRDKNNSTPSLLCNLHLFDEPTIQ
jgi:hypothetical protein